MRKLSKAQIRLLDKTFDKNPSISGVYDLPIEIYEQLERMGDHETIWQNINRYLSDRFFAEGTTKNVW